MGVLGELVNEAKSVVSEFEELSKQASSVASALNGQDKTTHSTSTQSQVVDNIYDEELENFIHLALENGVLTEKEKGILLKKAVTKGIDPDEFEMYLDTKVARLSATNPKSSLERLSEELKKAQGLFNLQTEDDIINSFPIPKNKSDLLELTIFFKTRYLQETAEENNKPDDFSDNTSAKKYQECIIKAKQYFSNDSDFIPLIQEYEDETAKREEKKALQEKIKKIIFAVIGVIVIAFLAYFLLHNTTF